MTATAKNSTPVHDDVPGRLVAVRAQLAAAGVQALLVPSADPHLSEYLPERWQGRRWLSGFTGSQATLVVAADKAALFADSRYWEQAEAELAGSGIDLVRIQTAASALHLEWLARELPKGATVAVDGQVLGLGAAAALRAALDAAGIALRTDLDLLDAAWPDRPGLPTEAVFEHAPPHATRTRAEKLTAVREAMSKHGATHHLVSSVDDVAWITNLRGADVTYNPVFLAHLLITQREATLYVGAGKVPRRWPTSSPRTGSRSRPTSRRATRSRRWGPVRRCSSTRSESPMACASARATGARSARRSTRARFSRAERRRRKPPSSARR